MSSYEDMCTRIFCFLFAVLALGPVTAKAEGSAWKASGPAGPGAAVKAPEHLAEDGLYARLKEMPYLYKNKDSEFLNQFKLLLTGQYQAAWVAPSGANKFRKGSGGHEDEWRRLQIGFEAVFLKNRLTLHSLTNMGETDGMYKLENGRWSRTKTDWGIFELYLKYKVNPSFFVRTGKITTKMMTEFRETASEIKTLERSDLVNQLGSISNWGIVLENPRQDVPVGWEAAVFLNDTSTSLAHEIQFNTEDNAFAKASVHMDARGFLPGEKSRVWLTYAHNFTHYAGRALPEDSYYSGLGARDVVTLDWVMSQGKFSMVTELMSGFRVVGDAYGENVYGLVLLPSYRFSPHLEGIFRYQLSHGRDAVKMFVRYVPAVTTYPKWVSTMNSFYFGLNYYVFPKDPDMLKFMVGGEYTATSGARGGAKCFNGWTWFTAVRFHF